MKVTMYGAPICPDCVVAKEQLANKEDVEVTYRDITAETAIMKEFLAYRDHEPCFEPIRKEGKIGIPFFILEDGTKTFDVAEHIEVDETIVRVGQVCSIDGKNCQKRSITDVKIVCGAFYFKKMVRKEKK